MSWPCKRHTSLSDVKRTRPTYRREMQFSIHEIDDIVQYVKRAKTGPTSTYHYQICPIRSHVHDRKEKCRAGLDVHQVYATAADVGGCISLEMPVDVGSMLLHICDTAYCKSWPNRGTLCRAPIGAHLHICRQDSSWLEGLWP